MARRSARSGPAEVPVGTNISTELHTESQRGQKRKRVVRDATPVKHETANEAEHVVNGTPDASTGKIEVQATETVTTTPRSNRRKKTVTYTEDDNASDHDLDPPAVKQATPAKRSKKIKLEQEQESHATVTGTRVTTTTTTKTTTRAPRKSKADKAAAMLPLAGRTQAHRYLLGAHVSAAGGVDKAVTNAVHIGANAFALFLKSQRKWANPALEEPVAEAWHACCATHGYAQGKRVVPHGSYLVNLAHTDPVRTEQAYGAFVDDLKRCERLGIGLYNFHPGNVQGVSRAEAIKHLAGNLNRAHKETKSVVTLLENMAAGGNVLGSTFEDLAETIELVDDKSRVGVCLDTCHAFAAGYDLRSKEALDNTLKKLDNVVGLKYLRALHLNDSKAPFDSRRDLHANIGTGFLGLRAFHSIMNDSRFEGLPIVLETPIEVYDDDGNPVKDEKGKDTKEDKGIWAREIKMLESLHGMDAECKEFTELEQTLAARGQKERARVQDQVDRKADKSKSKGVKKGKKKKDANTSDEDSE